MAAGDSQSPKASEDAEQEEVHPLPEWLVSSKDPFAETFNDAAIIKMDEQNPAAAVVKSEDEKLDNLNKADGLVSKEESVDDRMFLAPSKELAAYDGADVVRRGGGGAARKGRRACLFPGEVGALRPGAQLGEMEGWATDAPRLYLTYPEGYMVKLQGRTVHTTGRYTFLHCQNKGVACKDFYDSVVVFSEVSYIKQGPGGEETAIDKIPDHILQAAAAAAGAGAAAAAGAGAAAPVRPRAADPGRPVGCVGGKEEGDAAPAADAAAAAAAAAAAGVSVKEEHVSAGSAEQESIQVIDTTAEEKEGSPSAIKREMPKRDSRNKKRTKYAEDDSDDIEEDSHDEEDMVYAGEGGSDEESYNEDDSDVEF